MEIINIVSKFVFVRQCLSNPNSILKSVKTSGYVLFLSELCAIFRSKLRGGMTLYETVLTFHSTHEDKVGFTILPSLFESLEKMFFRSQRKKKKKKEKKKNGYLISKLIKLNFVDFRLWLRQ